MANGLTSGLYVTATPIGNLGDITLRAVDVLRTCDLILCEDTRVTGKLLHHLRIDTPARTYHDHNAPRVRPGILKRLEAGEAIALVSDAGTPLISDPGYKLVRDCLERGIEVIPVPGASAILAALMVSGLPSDRFFYAGFLPPKSAARRKALGELNGVPGTLIFLESARRLASSLKDMAACLGTREAVVARELTKQYEEVRRAALVDLAEHYKAEGPPKGEVVVLVGPADKSLATDSDLDAFLQAELKIASLRDAAEVVSKRTGVARRKVYARALELMKEADG